MRASWKTGVNPCGSVSWVSGRPVDPLLRAVLYLYCDRRLVSQDEPVASGEVLLVAEDPDPSSHGAVSYPASAVYV